MPGAQPVAHDLEQPRARRLGDAQAAADRASPEGEVKAAATNLNEISDGDLALRLEESLKKGQTRLENLQELVGAGKSFQYDAVVDEEMEVLEQVEAGDSLAAALERARALEVTEPDLEAVGEAVAVAVGVDRVAAGVVDVDVEIGRASCRERV